MILSGGFRTLRGMRDYLPDDTFKLNYVKGVVRRLFVLFGYGEVITPTVESYSLLEAKAGEEIRHRMYVFDDMGGRRVALRPEMTPSVARFYINHLLSSPKPVRLGYIANCFRYDEPQFGRYREFWQGGFELFGSSDPVADVEILSVAEMLVKHLGFKEYLFKLGHMGVLKGLLSDVGVSDRDQNSLLGLLDKGRLDEALDSLSSLGVSDKCLYVVRELFSLKGGDVERLFKAAEDLLADYPSALLALDNFSMILSLLADDFMGHISVDFSFARGLEYYTGLIFEYFVPGFKLALGGGGRYDGLISLFGGPSTPAVGFAPGLDRIVLAMEEKNLPFGVSSRRRVLLIPLVRSVIPYSLSISNVLRDNGIPVEFEVMGRSLKRSLSYASSHSFSHVIIVGKREYADGVLVLRDLEANVQWVCSLEEAIRKLG